MSRAINSDLVKWADDKGGTATTLGMVDGELVNILGGLADWLNKIDAAAHSAMMAMYGVLPVMQTATVSTEE